ncbi:MAG: flagellar basal body P-ring protein FlgI [Deltaproteobacteria bacterium]|nr:flagellar basal body P-ring protein FlgI [Deltaproteobacteria bacterium]
MRPLSEISYKILPFLFSVIIFMQCSTASAARLKDIASIKGVRSNQLIGYGLVVGLDGTGDGTGTKFTTQSLVNMMERLGIQATSSSVKVDNVAAVMVTADLPPFAREGSKVDVLVSSIGDAESLQGGTLLMTSLKGADNNIYAIAQGPMIVGGYSTSGASGTESTKNHPTVARIPNGASIEREIPFNFNELEDLTIALNDPDFTTARRISTAINAGLNGSMASALDSGTVRVSVPENYRDNMVELVASIEQIDIQPDTEAKIILSERTGTVIMGSDVRISAVAIAHGNLSVQIKESADVSQPRPFSQGQTVVTPDTEVSVTEDSNRLVVVAPEGTSLDSVVKALNAIGISPRDLITVFQAIKASGALQAELEII